MTQKSQEYEMACQERRSILQGGEEVNSAAVHPLQPAEGRSSRCRENTAIMAV